MSVTVAPHGIWKSPITGDSFTARSVTLSQVRVDGPDTYWVEGHPLQGGRGTLLRRRSTGETSEVLPLIDGTRLPTSAPASTSTAARPTRFTTASSSSPIARTAASTLSTPRMRAGVSVR